MVRWVPQLGEFAPLAIDLACQRNYVSDVDMLLWNELSEVRLDRDSSAWLRLMTHILTGYQQWPPWDTELQQLVDHLREIDPDLDLSELAEQGLRLGVAGVETW